MNFAFFRKRSESAKSFVKALSCLDMYHLTEYEFSDHFWIPAGGQEPRRVMHIVLSVDLT